MQGSLKAVPSSKPEPVFVSGEEGFNTFRIPSICRCKDGTLIALAEGRQSNGDQSANVIVMRRKTPGKVWGPTEILESQSPNALNDACLIASTWGTVYLAFQRYPAGYRESTIKDGYDLSNSCHTLLMESTDSGKTWSKPRDITEQVKPEDAGPCASGPGIGIELHRGPHKGRLIIPFNAGNSGRYYNFCAYSDDKGKTWHRGQKLTAAGTGNLNEVQVAEMSDGGVLLNSRSESRDYKRFQAVSKDGGETFSEAQPIAQLPDPICMGSLVRFSDKQNVLLFANPASTQGRENGTVYASEDDGANWKALLTISPGSYQYNCLCPLGKNEFGDLYETVGLLPNGKSGYKIMFQTFKLGKSMVPTIPGPAGQQKN